MLNILLLIIISESSVDESSKCKSGAHQAMKCFGREVFLVSKFGFDKNLIYVLYCLLNNGENPKIILHVN